MSWLEARIPPPAVAAIVALAMWGVSRVTPPLHMPDAVRLSACAAFALVGLTFGIAGMAAFRRAGTTVNPTKPELASSLVTSGIYRVTRNPMYVGLSFLLFACAVFLSSPWALLGVPFFVLYINRFQIVPEERVLSKLFGSEYDEYRKRVRRWL